MHRTQGQKQRPGPRALIGDPLARPGARPPPKTPVLSYEDQLISGLLLLLSTFPDGNGAVWRSGADRKTPENSKLERKDLK